MRHLPGLTFMGSLDNDLKNYATTNESQRADYQTMVIGLAHVFSDYGPPLHSVVLEHPFKQS